MTASDESGSAGDTVCTTWEGSGGTGGYSVVSGECYTIPDNAAPATVDVTLTIQDSGGNQASVEWTVTIGAPGTTAPPTTTAPPATTQPPPFTTEPPETTAPPGTTAPPALTVTASDESGSAGDTVCTTWEGSGGTGGYSVVSGECYTIPDNAAPATVDVTLTIQDSGGNQASVEWTVTIGAPGTTAPPTTTAPPATTQPPPFTTEPPETTAPPGTTAPPALTVTASDESGSAGDTVCTTWEGSGGTGGYSVVSGECYTIPDNAAPATVDVTLTIQDSGGNQASVEWTVTIGAPGTTAPPTTTAPPPPPSPRRSRPSRPRPHNRPPPRRTHARMRRSRHLASPTLWPVGSPPPGRQRPLVFRPPRPTPRYPARHGSLSRC